MLETWGSLGGTWEPGAGFNVPLYNWAINTYASNGDALSMTDSVMGAWSYTYDDFNRLASGNATAGVDSGLSLGWTYDLSLAKIPSACKIGCAQIVEASG